MCLLSFGRYMCVTSARMLNEEEVVVITITTPEKDTQQHAEWLHPRGLEGCIIQVSPVVISCATRR